MDLLFIFWLFKSIFSGQLNIKFYCIFTISCIVPRCYACYYCILISYKLARLPFLHKKMFSQENINIDVPAAFGFFLIIACSQILHSSSGQWKKYWYNQRIFTVQNTDFQVSGDLRSSSSLCTFKNKLRQLYLSPTQFLNIHS